MGLPVMKGMPRSAMRRIPAPRRTLAARDRASMIQGAAGLSNRASGYHLTYVTITTMARNDTYALTKRSTISNMGRMETTTSSRTTS